METLLVDRADNGVVTLTLNRPEKKNAINGTMFNELLDVFRQVNDSTADRVLVITGAGDARARTWPTAGTTRATRSCGCTGSRTSRWPCIAFQSRSSRRSMASRSGRA